MSGLTKEAIEKIESLIRKENKVEYVDGNAYSDFNLQRIYSDTRPKAFTFSTLDGIADYIHNNLDGVAEDGCIIIIDSVDKVSIWSPVKGESNQRNLIAEAVLENVKEYPFDRYIEQEKFIIGVSSLFEETDSKDEILAAASTMQILDEKSGTDEGGTTKLGASHGVICGVDKPKTVQFLKPFRTFREVDQPISAFIFRYKAENGRPALSLIEADGGAWKIQAKKSIKEYLSSKVKTPIIS